MAVTMSSASLAKMLPRGRGERERALANSQNSPMGPAMLRYLRKWVEHSRRVSDE